MKVNGRKRNTRLLVNEWHDEGTVRMQWMISNTWSQLYKVMESGEDNRTTEYRQDGIVEKNVRSDVRQVSTGLSEREGVQGGSETSNDVWVGEGGTDEKTGGGDAGGRVEDVTIFVRCDKNGQDQE